MSEKNKPNSYLNQRSTVDDIQESTMKVQTETLTTANVKITSDLASYANPYSILTNDYVENKTRVAAVTYVINPAELAKNEVKLPQLAHETRAEDVEMFKKVAQTVADKVPEKVEEKAPEKVVEEEIKPKYEYKMSDIPTVETAPKAPEMSDMERLNRLAAYKDAPQTAEPAPSLEIPKDAELLNVPKEETTVNNLEVLNELQAEETEAKKKSNKKQELNSAMNGLEGLLAELSDDDGSNTLGMG